MDKIKNYIKLMRINHYLKNILIFLPLLFSASLFKVDLLIKTFVGFIVFSLIASTVYIINDICDKENDKKHEVKKNRPIASGKVSVAGAIILAIVLMIISVLLNIYIVGWNIYSYIVVFLYLALNLCYSFGLKNKPIIDIIILVSGFILRLIYGSIITSIALSNWLYLTVMAASFYMGLGKRRNEILKQGDKSREVLKRYSKSFLDKNMYVCVTLCIVFYSLWAVDSLTIFNIGHELLIWTIPLVIIILMKYSLNIEGDSYGDPIDVVLADKMLLTLILVYGAVMFTLIYLI